MSTTWIQHYPLPDDLKFGEEHFRELLEEKPEEKHTIKMFGKEMKTPRFVQAFGKDYKYSGNIAKAKPIPEILKPIIEHFNKKYECNLNGILVNFYMDGNDYISMHRDNEKTLNKKSPIVSISLGDTRKFVLQDMVSKEKTVYNLENNDVLVMGGTCQQTHKHGVPKQKNKGMRINITIREFI
tara:strand:- start:125 stop:673 length:549 start_codon:yes stop_codon:yes gene_type:complete